MKTGLVLEGGAQRGIYTAGVLDVFLEKGISFDGVLGVSAGAIHGCSFVSKQHNRSINYVLKYTGHKNFMSFYSLLTTGNMVGEKFCYDELPNKLVPFDYEGFKNSATDFYVTCTNLKTGQAEYILCADLKEKMPYLRASASMPFVSRISHIAGNAYLDGGIADSIPVRGMQKLGYDKCVVVATRVAGYQKKKNKLSFLAPLFYHKYPRFIEAIKNRHIMYNKEVADIDTLVQAGQVFVIRPSRLIKIKHAEKDLNVIRAVYELGRKDALKQIDALQKFLAS